MTNTDREAKFLYDIGEQSLPNAFFLLERKLRAGTASKILSDSNVVFYLEMILKRYVYGKMLSHR